MPDCPRMRTCAFFSAEGGYSPALHDAMKEHFCLANNSTCCRLAAIGVVGADNVPVHMLPTDDEMLADLKSTRT